MIGIGIGLPFGAQQAGGGGAAPCEPVDQIDGAVSAPTTFTHPADGVIGLTVTTLASSGSIQVRFRSQDSSNYWQLLFFGDDILLREVVGGGATTRGSALDVLVNGHRVVIVADGTTISVYSNDVLRVTYASATSFATATNGQLNSLATGGAVSDIKTWGMACIAEELPM